MKLKVTTNGECCVMCRHFTQEIFLFNPIKCITHQNSKNQLATKQQKVSDLVLD